MLGAWPRGLLALIGLYRGKLGEAAAHLVDYEHLDPSVPSPVGPQSPRVAIARCLLREAYGDPAAGLGVLRRAWDVHASRGNMAALALLAPDLVRLALVTRDSSTAEVVARAIEHAARLQPGITVATAWRCRGLVDGDPDMLVKAAHHLARSPRRFEHAQACETAATELARAGRHREAKPLFDWAIDVFEDLGARRGGASPLPSARSLGIGRKRRGARKRPALGWEALTPSEHDVVALVAEGLTNPEVGQRLFVSRRTVQTHLSSAFRKLEITSRVELAALVERRGQASPELGGSR
jgi:DNA-binding CsgD family transcriptional regulator